ncbi:MAG: TonB-dependent receptor [Hyphomonas sp.]|nr:TonB-dependent receptor [Hyphomonas sp.]
MTGTNIKGARINEALPVTVLSADDISTLGTIDGDDLIRSLPASGATNFSNSNTSTVNSARGDVGSINLRSIGSSGTLVLLNGRRVVNHPGTQVELSTPVTTVNTNALPVAGVQRMEVLNDGASAIYGSDAVAGVVNMIMRDDYEGLEVSGRYGWAENTGLNEKSIELRGGKTFNGGKTNVSFFAEYAKRDAQFANELDYTGQENLMPFVEGTSFEGDTSFNNLDTGSPWGQFTLMTTSGTRVRQNGATLTSASGVFHLQPDSYTGCLGTTATDLATPGICIDDGSLDSTLRYNEASVRTVISDRDRFNLYTFLNHDLDNGMRSYSEFSAYYAETNPVMSATSPIAGGDIVVPANNYWNPFGPVMFSDGSLNPNRLPGLTNVPDEGLPVFVDGGRFRLVDVGPRRINVENTSFRALTGLRGQLFDTKWDFDTAILYNWADTNDVTANRISSTLFQQALFNETPSAYNMFNGGNQTLLTEGDGPGNDPASFDQFRIDVKRNASTSLALADFKISTGELFNVWGGSVGLATGVEVRRETFEEDRDDRLDGTITFTDLVTGITTDSDVMNTSGTPDTKGDRTVLAAFVEASVPLVSPDMNIPLVDTLDIQLAARIEDYSDFGSSGVKPRVAVAWKPFDALKFRGAWSEGFRAPNLIVLNQDVTRENTYQDNVFCQAGVENGTFATFSACTGYSNSTQERRVGADDIGPEEDRNITYGFVFEPRGLTGSLGFLNNLTVTVDRWDIERQDVVGVFGGGNQIDLDLVLRLMGESNPNVVRAAPTVDEIAFFAGTSFEGNEPGQIIYLGDTYDNNEDQSVKGIDYAVYYDLDDTAFGDFGLKVNATKLEEYFISVSPGSQLINDAVESGLVSSDISVSQEGDILGIDGQPEWRMSASLTWRHDSGFGAGARYDYIGSFEEPGPGVDADGNYWKIESYSTVNAYAQYETGEAAGAFRDVTFRFGINNLSDEKPPLADEVFGYFNEYHSSRGRYYYVDVSKKF